MITEKQSHYHKLNSASKFLLQPFYTATSQLEGNQELTLHLVIPYVAILKRGCAISDDDSEEIKTLKSSALHYIEVC